MSTDTFITTIRDRGQITLPQKLRRHFGWGKNTVLKITSKTDKIEIASHQLAPQPKNLSQKDWDKLFKEMERIRNLGNQNVNLSKFIQQDRLNRS